MTTNTRTAFLGGLVGGGLAVVVLVLLVLSTGVLFAHAQTPPTNDPTSNTKELHERMDRMIDAMHGDGASQRMHEAMGPDAEELMDQCVGMMGMMQDMQGMMGGHQGNMSMGNMMQGIMGGRQGDMSMGNMMGGMMGQ